MFRALVFGPGRKVCLGFCLGFGVEGFRIGRKILGFGGGFWVWGFEIWRRVLGFRVLEFCLEFGFFCFWIGGRVLCLGFFDLS